MPQNSDFENLYCYLAKMDVGEYAQCLWDAGWIGESLGKLDRENLADLGIPKLKRADIMQAIAALLESDAPPTLPTPDAPSYAPSLSDNVRIRCRQLADFPTEPWVEAVIGQWPSPIAHEYWRLRELLRQGEVVAAILQLKDVAEVLIKFPALVLARDVIEHGTPKMANNIRSHLLGQQLSLGDWIGLLRDKLAKPLAANDAIRNQLCFPQLAEPFIGKQGSAWLDMLQQMLQWRNGDIAHGAFKLELAEYLDGVEKDGKRIKGINDYLQALNHHLAAIEAQGCWSGLSLRGADDGPLLQGAEAIRHWHDSDSGRHSEHPAQALFLHGHGKTLALAPYVMLRRCGICDQRDVFLYDTRAGRDEKAAFLLLDYLRGHRLDLPPHRAEGLASEAQDIKMNAAPEYERQGEIGQDYLKRDIIDLLESKASESRYIQPEYLHQPLREFIAGHDRGIYWLLAPGHIGKSVFVRSIVDHHGKESKTRFLEDVAAAALFIRREYRVWPEQLRSFLLKDIAEGLFGLMAGEMRLPELDTGTSNPAAAFADVLQRMAPFKPKEDKLVICLDGLDELPPMEDGKPGIAAYLPEAEQLPEGFYLLLTSRPLTETPPHVRKTLETKFGDDSSLFRRVEFKLPLPGNEPSISSNELSESLSAAYRALMRQYFDRRLRDRLLADIYTALREFISQNAEGGVLAVRDNDLNRILPPGLRDTAKADWQQLTAKLSLSGPTDAPALGSKVLSPVLQAYDMAFAHLLDKSQARFLYLAHLTELCQDGRIAFADLPNLPQGTGLYRHYLEQLQRLLGGGAGNAKPWEFTRRLLLTLAASEQAHLEFLGFLPPAYRNQAFLGVPLDILAWLMAEPPRGVRLVFTLYSMKGALAVWKGDDARDTRYGLGLKDLLDTIAALWPDELRDQHAKLSERMFQRLEGRWEEVSADDAIDVWMLHYGYAHGRLAGQEYGAQWLHNERFSVCLVQIGNEANDQINSQLANACYSVEIMRAEYLHDVLGKQMPSLRATNLAMVYMNRGNARDLGGDIHGALEDYAHAVSLGERLREILKEQWLPKMANDLAICYLNRGIAFDNNGDWSSALGDYQRAIELGEAIRKLLKEQWPLQYCKYLASFYMHRGVAFYDSGDASAAQVDYGQAITLQEVLQERLKGQWPLEWANDLAAAYLNMGVLLSKDSNVISGLKYYEEAVRLRETLRERLKDQLPSQWAYDLTVTYIEWGITLSKGGYAIEALDNYGRAIDLGENLIEQLKEKIPPMWVYDLSRVYLSRGIIFYDANNVSEALRNYGRAIDLGEIACKCLKELWPLQWANTLALAYEARGIARKTLGDAKFEKDTRRAAEIRAMFDN